MRQKGEGKQKNKFELRDLAEIQRTCKAWCWRQIHIQRAFMNKLSDGLTTK